MRHRAPVGRPIEAALFERAELLPREWDRVAGASPLHRRRALAAIEPATLAAGLGCAYALLHRRGEPLGAVSFQRASASPLEARGGGRPRGLPGALSATLLVAGNLVVTGLPAVVARPDQDPAALLAAAVRATRARLGRRLGAVLLKDVPPGVDHRPHALAAAGFRRARLEQTMVLPIRPGWRDLSDYLGDLRAKYRFNLRKVRRLGAVLERRRLSTAELTARRAEIDRLYRHVHDRASFPGPYLGAHYIEGLARGLGPDAFAVDGYFRGERLVAWNSRLVRDRAVDSYLFGFEAREGRARCLLQNLMLDDLAHAIAIGARELHLGRTTHELKSALGAEPRRLDCYYRPLGPLSWPVCRLACAIYQEPTWTPRHPFRTTPA